MVCNGLENLGLVSTDSVFLIKGVQWVGFQDPGMCSDLNFYPRKGSDTTPCLGFMLIPEIPVGLPSTKYCLQRKGHSALNNQIAD